MLRKIAVALLLVLPTALFAAETFPAGGGNFKAKREIKVPAASEKAAIIVTAFLHEGLIATSEKGDPRLTNVGRSIIVLDKRRKPVPFKILQLGPGDFCRLAIQAVEKNDEYNIFYGAETPTPLEVPPWTSDQGLFMETRQYRHTNMDDFQAVKSDFEKATPIGADYVQSIMHGYNPMVLKQTPFMTRYTGKLHVAQGGDYAVLTSSHHCSFLLIDGKVVASHAGRHGRQGAARPELVKKIRLSAGTHALEYYHATADNHASMLVVWELNPGEKMKPALIPPEAYGAGAVAHIRSGPVAHPGTSVALDFEYEVTGSVPLPDHEDQLISVQFSNKTVPPTVRGKSTWDFGDGQKSTEQNPYHIYLKPGTYRVALSSESGEATYKAVNRLEIDPPVLQPEKPHTIDNYLKSLETYDTTKLDAENLLQLVEAFEYKIDLLRGGVGYDDVPFESLARQTQTETTKYRTAIVTAVRTALAGNGPLRGDHEIHALALSAGTLARDYLEDWKSAGQIYNAAAKRITQTDLSAECTALAADVALDMGNLDAAKRLIDDAVKRMNKTALSAQAGAILRIQGDVLGASGDGEAARAAFRAAQQRNFTARGYSERVALQGSASRSAEGYIKTKHFERAIGMLREWQREYPAAAVEGYITLLFAEYWAAKGKNDLATRLADRLIAINPDSPYVDRILFLAAQVQTKAGNREAAEAYLKSLLKDYPGSPLVEEAKKMAAGNAE